MAIQSFNPKAIFGGAILFLVLVNFLIIPKFRGDASSIEKQHIAKIPYEEHHSICLTEAEFIYVAKDRMIAYAQELSNEKLWEFKLDPEEVIIQVIADETSLYLLDNSLYLYKITSKTGTLEWKNRLAYPSEAGVSLSQNNQAILVEQASTEEVERYVYAKSGTSMGGFTGDQLLNHKSELPAYIKEKMNWAKMEFFADKGLFFDPITQQMYKLGERVFYVKEHNTFFVKSLSTTSLHRIDEMGAVALAKYNVLDSEAEFDYYQEGYLSLTKEDQLKNQEISFFTFDGFELEMACVFDHRKGKKLNKGLYLLFIYDKSIEVNHIKNYSSINHKQHINLGNRQFVQDVQLGTHNFFVKAYSEFDFGVGVGVKEFYYTIPLDYANDGVD